MDYLTDFFASMVALSMGVERIIEIGKEGFDWRASRSPAGSARPQRQLPRQADGTPSDHVAASSQGTPKEPSGPGRCFTIHFSAAVVGTVLVIAIGPHYFLSPIPPAADYRSFAGWVSAAMLGLMASGGSAFWNHALDIMAAFKSLKEGLASERRRDVTRNAEPNTATTEPRAA